MSKYNLETEEDMASYLDINYGHGLSAVYTNYQDVQSTINIILNDEYLEDDDGIGIEGNQPIAYCRSIDVPNVLHGDTLSVSAVKDVDGNTLKDAQSYKVVNVQKDKTGFTALMLEET
tara:strand:- start:3086 stop:3439 length:354 start_codon:yes stop_codon:yes gene_type:complete